MATNKNKPKTNSSTSGDGGSQSHTCHHTKPLEEHISQIRFALDKREEELKAIQHNANEMQRQYENEINKLRAALQQREQETQASRERAQWDEQQHDARMAENYYRQELHKIHAALVEKGKEAEYYKHSLSERENYFQRKMEEIRAILQQKDEELKSFKDRVAGDVALSIKTGKAESMNNPVSKTRLKEMYEDLRTLWPTIKKNLKSNGKSPESIKAKLQKIFTDASASMEQQKSLIDNLYGLDESTSRSIYQKVHEYRKATIQYLQLTLYHNRKDEAESKSSLLQHEGSSVDVMEFLVSQCHWLGILMALNDPPLQPDWENHDPGMNEWDILPRNLSSSTSAAL